MVVKAFEAEANHSGDHMLQFTTNRLCERSEAIQAFLDFGFFSHREHRDTERRTQRIFIYA